MLTFKFPFLSSFSLSPFNFSNLPSLTPLKDTFEKEEKKKKNVCLVVPRKSSLIYFNVDNGESDGLAKKTVVLRSI